MYIHINDGQKLSTILAGLALVEMYGTDRDLPIDANLLPNEIGTLILCDEDKALPAPTPNEVAALSEYINMADQDHVPATDKAHALLRAVQRAWGLCNPASPDFVDGSDLIEEIGNLIEDVDHAIEGLLIDMAPADTSSAHPLPGPERHIIDRVPRAFVGVKLSDGTAELTGCTMDGHSLPITGDGTLQHPIGVTPAAMKAVDGMAGALSNILLVDSQRQQEGVHGYARGSMQDRALRQGATWLAMYSSITGKF